MGQKGSGHIHYTLVAAYTVICGVIREHAPDDTFTTAPLFLKIPTAQLQWWIIAASQKTKQNLNTQEISNEQQNT